MSSDSNTRETIDSGHATNGPLRPVAALGNGLYVGWLLGWGFAVIVMMVGHDSRWNPWPLTIYSAVGGSLLMLILHATLTFNPPESGSHRIARVASAVVLLTAAGVMVLFFAAKIYLDHAPPPTAPIYHSVTPDE